MVGGGEHKVVLDESGFRAYSADVDWGLNFLSVNGSSSTSRWLEAFLTSARGRKGYCMSWHCPKCGLRFRNELLDVAAAAIRWPGVKRMDDAIASELLSQVGLINPRDGGRFELVSAVRLIFCLIWDAVGKLAAAIGKPRVNPRVKRMDDAIASELLSQLALINPRDGGRFELVSAVRLIFCLIWEDVGELGAVRLAPRVARSWAGGILASMQAHHRYRMEKLRLHKVANSPEQVKLRRELKRRQKQEAHAQRLELKKERDRAWHEAH